MINSSRLPEKPSWDLFDGQDIQEWIQRAARELKDEDPMSRLSVEKAPGVSASPYYNTRVEELAYLRAFDNRYHTPTINTYAPRDWYNCQYISVDNENKANRLALKALMAGAEGVYFDLRDSNTITLAQLLNEIDLRYCYLIFHIDSNNGFKEEIEAYIEALPQEQKVLHGLLLNDQNDDALPLHLPNFRSIVVSEKSHSSENMIDIMYEVLNTVCKLIASYESQQSVTKLFDQLAINCSIGVDFFKEIARIRAYRILTYQLARIYGLDDYEPENLVIHTRVDASTINTLEPHGEMLYHTTAILASVLGGAHAITPIIKASAGEEDYRIARNVSHILKEESHVNKTIDPVAGSYYIDDLTDQIISTVWSKLQLTQNS